MNFKYRSIVISLLIGLFLISGCGKKEADAPGEGIVATYGGKTLTDEELRDYIRRRGFKERSHAICEKHGFDHSQCDKLEPCESHPLHSIEAYRTMIEMLVMEEMVENWAREKGITGRREVKHGLKHLVEEINLESLSTKMHEDEFSPDKIEMQQYYEEHREEYKSRSFNEVEREIENILTVEKGDEFIPEYIERLKENAVISRNYDLLEVAAPTAAELRTFYQDHQDEYVEPEKINILEIRIDIGSSGAPAAARRKAEEARAKLGAFEDFSEVAQEYSDGIYPESGAGISDYIRKGERSDTFEDYVFILGINEISDVFQDGESFFVVKVIEKQDQRQKELAEVREEIKTKVIREKEDIKYELNKFEALFTVHGKRFTLGEFKEEFSELPPEYQLQFSEFEEKKYLVDQLIIKELLLEDVGDTMLDRENKELVENLKAEVIQHILHKEEVDEKIEVSDEEAKEIYEVKKSLFIEPAKAKISYIRVRPGPSDDEEDRARKIIEEAYQKIKGGAAFASVAREYSEDRTASQGGKLNRWVYEGGSHLGEMMEHEFHKVVFKLRPGEESRVFKFGGDFFIVKMRRKDGKRQQTFEEARDYIKELLAARKHQERTSRLQDELFEKAKLTVCDATLKRMLKEEERQSE